MHFASNKFLNQAVYITMPDDIKIAADIWLPKTIETGRQYPLIVEFTRYWRTAENAAAIIEVGEQIILEVKVDSTYTCTYG